jgi:hypothetical protein
MRQEFGDKYPEYWATIGVRDTALSKQWTQSFQSLTLPDGEVDPRFVETAQTFMQYSALDKDRAFDHITDAKAKARMQAVLSRAQIDGDLVSAVRQRALVEQNNAKGGFTKETKEEITDEVNDIMEGTILPNFLGGRDALDSFNTDYVRATVRRMVGLVQKMQQSLPVWILRGNMKRLKVIIFLMVGLLSASDSVCKTANPRRML